MLILAGAYSFSERFAQNLSEVILGLGVVKPVELFWNLADPYSKTSFIMFRIGPSSFWEHLILK